VSKADRMRDQQQIINKQQEEIRQLKAQLYQYRKRDRPMAGDNIKITRRN